MRPRSAILGGLNRIFLMSTFVVFPLVTQPSARADDADQPPSPAIDYTQRIKPLLQQHCVSCHGEEKQASGLRLDVGGYLMRGGDRGAAVKAGSPAESLLYQVLFEGDDVEQMPSEEPPLPATAIATIRTWIAQGAKMPDAELAAAKLRQTSDHWAFQTIRRPAIPPLNDPWIRNPIDAFVLARLRQARLSPSAVADRGVLIRRLSLDLLGVTPAPEDVRAFANDRRPDAYERLVERMLASPRYGERWGRHWLDLARYADSNGFTIDGPRSIWKYRDWVIDAINRGDPYDDFATAQLAGDLLPDATRDQIVATGFHRNTLINQEGGTDDEQFRVEAVVDRVTTTGSVFLGLTLICAQCHEHKYDPVTQRDFYSLYAFFNNTADVNSLAPTMRLPSDRQAAEEAQVKDRIKTIQAALKEHDSKVASQQPAWEAQMKQAAAFDWQVLDPATFVSKQRATINKKEDLSLIVGGNGNIPSRDTYTVVADTKLAEVAAVRLEALTDTGLPKNGPGLADDGLFVLSELRVTASPLGADGKPGSETQLIEFTRTATDQAQAGFPSDQVIDGNEGTGWSIATTKAEGSANRDRELIAVARQSIESEHGWRLKIEIIQRDAKAKHQIGRFRLSAASGVDSEQPVLATEIRKLLDIVVEKREPAQKAAIAAAYRRTDQNRKPLEAQFAQLKKREGELNAAIPTSMVLRELDEPREAYIQIRGDFLRKGAVVKPATPSVLPEVQSSLDTANRLDLARWLFAPENPLTSRVTVNRHWQRFFGLGLIETENDFGSRADPPSHPRLLDWLASELIELDWNWKQLHRLIVTSASYRQSSKFRPKLAAQDPRNRLLGRQSRVRLDAEAIRDCSLSASGQITSTIGGPSVYPPQPEGIHVLTQVTKQWPEEQGANRYRRAMYTYFWRSNPYPFLPTFDAPRANTTCTRRSRSNTPLQALTLANDRVFFELAQGLGERIQTRGGETMGERMRYAMLTALSREPTEYEQQRLIDYWNAQRAHYEADEKVAKLVAAPGAKKLSDSAAWTTVARVLLNLDEFITRD